MKPEMIPVFATFGIGVVLTMIVGFYCVTTTRNLVRALIGMELLTKGVTLAIVLAGYVSGQEGLAQSLAITMIIIEVAVIVVAVSLVLGIYRKTAGIDTNSIREIKG
jgi:NADH-quinone oxidoreductase subunit K